MLSKYIDHFWTYNNSSVNLIPFDYNENTGTFKSLQLKKANYAVYISSNFENSTIKFDGNDIKIDDGLITITPSINLKKEDNDIYLIKNVYISHFQENGTYPCTGP